MSDWTPTARTMVASGADAIRYSSSAVFPIPASPRSTSDWLSPRRIAATNSSSSAHSLPRPRRPARPAGSRERPPIAHDPSGIGFAALDLRVRRGGQAGAVGDRLPVEARHARALPRDLAPRRGSAPEKRKAPPPRGFRHAPKRTRTSTRLSRTRPSTWRVYQFRHRRESDREYRAAPRSAGVAHARGDAVDGEEARARQLLAVAVAFRPGAAQELDLEQRHRVDVGVAAVDRGTQEPLAGEQPLLAGDGQQREAGAV